MPFSRYIFIPGLGTKRVNKEESLKAADLDCSWLPVVVELSALLLLLSFSFSFCDAGKAFRYLWELSRSCHHLGFVRGLIDWLILDLQVFCFLFIYLLIFSIWFEFLCTNKIYTSPLAVLIYSILRACGRIKEIRDKNCED